MNDMYQGVRRAGIIFLKIIAFFGVTLGALIALLVLFAFSASDSVQCENEAGQKILFSYEPAYSTVDIGGYPTHHPGSSWVSFLDVRDEGFMLVYTQGTYSREIDDIRDLVHVNRYKEGEGFTTWYDVPPEEAKHIRGLDTLPRQEPETSFNQCSEKAGGWILQLLITGLRV